MSPVPPATSKNANGSPEFGLMPHADLAVLFKFNEGTTGSRRPVRARVSALEHYKETFTDFSADYDNAKTTAILLSSKIIKNNTLKKLGIKGISFKLPILGSGFPKMVNEPSFLPVNTNSVFLFNLKESIQLDQTRLSGSIPFDLKGNFNVDDYNILIPITYLQSLKVSPVFLEDFLIACSDQIMYYNSPLELDSPLLITVISKSEPRVKNVELANSVTSSSSSSSSTSKLSSLYFELMSKNWLQSSVKSIDLLQSTFCFINNDELKAKDNKQNKSICLRINDTEKTIDISPSFDSEHKLNFNEIVPSLSSSSHEKHQKRDEYPTYSNDTGNKMDRIDAEDSSFKIQVGNNTLTENERAFENVTRCLEEEEYDIPQQPLSDTLFGQSELIGMKSFEHAPVLILQPRPANYKQILDTSHQMEKQSFTF
ncbi:hypothetical protein PMKS-001455 [Pichia membranifaciens]|uniref:Uncharacterized protein n=1 Tax=Pichia membranifaciens TaxID=4926 RepID=A0A1Q2YEJ8_9ASCO|nr:hypothetical protein PMKS-001455 [Pichia membranifaciens]